MGKDKIVLLSTHIVSDIEAIANEIVVMKKGNILKTGNVNEIVRSVKGQVWETVVSHEVYQKLRMERAVIHFKTDGERSAGSLCWRTVSRCGELSCEPNTGRLLYLCRRR